MAARPTRPDLLLVLFSSCLLLSAFLLFWIQPLFTKTILPVLGGAPSVWNTAVVCFQTLLLAGYWYADRVTRIRAPARQAWLHALVLGGATAWVWLAPGELQGSADAAHTPVGWLLSTLLLHIGYPFFLLATTSTLLQRWYVNLRQDDDVYWLYVISNAGSMLGVFGFIIGIEPLVGLTRQALLFKWCFTVLAALLLVAAAVYSKGLGATPRTETMPDVGWRLKLRWLLLAAVPSSLLLSTTTHITMDIAPVPLLWMLLLALYLISFMMAFSRWKKLSLALFLKWQMFLCVPLLADFFLNITASGGVSIMLWHMAAFFVTATVCHRLLYESRPPGVQLTTFYLYIALGGAVGGMFTTFLAPLLFDSLLEYPLTFAAAFALRPAAIPIGATWRRDIATGAAMLALLAAALYTMSPLLHPLHFSIIGVLLMLGIFAVKLCFDQATRPLRLAACYTAAIMAGLLLTHIGGKTIEAQRNFYGIITIDGSNPEVYSMRHGTTIHGIQYIGGKKHMVPLTYYHPSGPLGDVMRAAMAQAKSLNIGAIGLGTGSMACYGRSDDRFTFFEINPAVIAFANDTKYFSFLHDCASPIDIEEGDARIVLQNSPQIFDVLVIDAFTSDAVPVHLLTKQAFELYQRHIRPGGVIAVHISNRYIDLGRVLAAVAHDMQLDLKLFGDNDMAQEPYKQPSTWAVLGSREAVAALDLPDHWREITASSAGDEWTDDYSNIFWLLRK